MVRWLFKYKVIKKNSFLRSKIAKLYPDLRINSHACRFSLDAQNCPFQCVVSSRTCKRAGLQRRSYEVTCTGKCTGAIHAAVNGQGNRADVQAPFGFDADSRVKLGRDQTKLGKIKGDQGLNSGFTTGTPTPEVNIPEQLPISQFALSGIHSYPLGSLHWVGYAAIPWLGFTGQLFEREERLLTFGCVCLLSRILTQVSKRNQIWWQRLDWHLCKSTTGKLENQHQAPHMTACSPKHCSTVTQSIQHDIHVCSQNHCATDVAVHSSVWQNLNLIFMTTTEVITPFYTGSSTLVVDCWTSSKSQKVHLMTKEKKTFTTQHDSLAVEEDAFYLCLPATHILGKRFTHSKDED